VFLLQEYSGESEVLHVAARVSVDTLRSRLWTHKVRTWKRT
jgi:hypothetical protein